MKKTIEKLLCIILTCAMFFVVGCNNGNEGNDSQNSDNGNESHYNNGSEIIVEPTANTIIEKKRSSYKILIPDDPETNEEKAASELSYFLYEATEVLLPIVTDSQAQPSGKYISLGNTSVLNSAGLKGLNSELGLEGYRIKTVGDNVWIGAGVQVMPGVRIGSNVVIGGGSVVVHDIPDNVIAVGNPCRVMKKIENETTL